MKKYLVISLFVVGIVFVWFSQKDVSATQTSSIVAQGNANAVRMPSQESSFYAAGRYWVFYTSDPGKDFAYKTSTDGENWSEETVLKSMTSFIAASFDIEFDGTNIHYITTNEAKGLYYRRGVPESDGTITWAAAEQTVRDETYTYADPSLAIDTDGHPWVGYLSATDSFKQYVTTASTTDGTWTTATDYPYYFSGITGHCVKLVSQTEGKIYAIVAYYGGGNERAVVGYPYDGESWGDQEAVTTSYLKTTKSGGAYGAFDAISYDDDIHFVFQASSTSDIRYVMRDTGTTTWTAEEVLVATADRSDKSSPVITKWDTDTFYMFWEKLPTIYYLINDGGTWDQSPNTFLSDFGIVVDVERCIQPFEEPYSVGGTLTGGILYLPVIDDVYQQTFVSYTELRPAGAVTPTSIPVQFLNGVTFKNGVHIKD